MLKNNEAYARLYAISVITPAAYRIIANAIRPEETCIDADCLAYYQNISLETTGTRAD